MGAAAPNEPPCKLVDRSSAGMVLGSWLMLMVHGLYLWFMALVFMVRGCEGVGKHVCGGGEGQCEWIQRGTGMMTDGLVSGGGFVAEQEGPIRQGGSSSNGAGSQECD